MQKKYSPNAYRSQNLEYETTMQTLKVFTIAHTHIVRNMLEIYTNK